MATAAQLATSFGDKVVPPPNQTGKKFLCWSMRRTITRMLEMQQEMHKEAMKKTQKAHTKATCARVYSDLEESIRIIEGRPAPGQFRPDLKPVKNGKSTTSWEEPKQVQDAVVVVQKQAEVSKDVPSVGQAEHPKTEKA